MAVVRAGDAEPNSLLSDIAAPPSSQPSQTLSVDGIKVEPFALAEDYPINESGDRHTPIMIPPPPAVPIDLIQKAPSNRHASEDIAPQAHPIDPEPPIQPRLAAAQAATGSIQDVTSNRRSKDTGDPSQQAASDSTAGTTPGVSKRRKYSLVAVAITSMVLVGAVLALINAGNHTATNPNIRLQPALQQPVLPKLIDAPPVAHLSNDPAPRQVAAAESAAPAPSAAAAPSETVQRDTTRVTLDLSPIDAKVLYLGREVSGPPFVFEVAKGQRMAIEVLRFGFVTAKVVLDDKKPLVHFGMLRERRPKAK
jgi:hypothetical protein